METSRLTAKYQATVPADVRAALGLQAGDTIAWDIADGNARVRKIAALDLLFLKGVEANLAEEWLSAEDMDAFRDL
jgi:antitoxin PrlF